MPTARYSRTADYNFGSGYRTLAFNPTGDSAGAEVDNVSFSFLMSYDGGRAVDLGDVDIYLRSPEGRRINIYDNFDGFGRDTDDGNDSDSADDYDIYFSGNDSRSNISVFFDGQAVGGNWQLEVDNRTGETLTLYDFSAAIDYSAPDVTVRDISFSGTAAVGERMKVTADLANIGNRYIGPFGIEYYVNGSLIGTDTLSGGLLGGQSNSESISYRVASEGAQNVQVRIVDANGDSNTGNNTRTESFVAAGPLEPDVIVRDILLKGRPEAGETIRIEAVLENIGTERIGQFDVEYWVNGRLLGDDSVSFGLLAGRKNSETIRADVSATGSFDVEVRVVGTSGESSTANNSRTEYLGVERGGTQKSVANSAEEVKLAMFMARAVYGDTDMPDDLDGDPSDNGRDDRYDTYLSRSGWTVLAEDDLGLNLNEGDAAIRFQPGGLYEGLFGLGGWKGQALLAEGETEDGSKTLALTFRGTDSKDWLASLLGQAWSGDGLYEQYTALRPMIDAAISYANDPANGIDKMVVSGHSLGGSMVDVFASVDAQRLKPSVDLTTVAFASAGIDGNVYTDTALFKGFDAEYDVNVVNNPGGNRVILSLPSHYIGISHGEDSVTFAERIDNGTTNGFVPNGTLRSNINFDAGITALNLPNIDNDQLDSGSTPAHGFGAEHNSGLYWANVSLLADDPLIESHTNQRISMGVTDYATAVDFDDSIFGVFPTYTGYGTPGFEDDTGPTALTGRALPDYILGLGGNDQLFGLGGDDLLSGGAGEDLVSGGRGADILHGGAHDDTIVGGSGADEVYGGNGSDLARMGAGNDHFHDTLTNGRDRVMAGGGRDTIDGGGGRDEFYGGGGGDLIRGGAAGDQISGGGGADRLFGGAGADRISGGKGGDTIDMGRGNDRYEDTRQGGTAGADTIAGGPGRDTFVFSAAPSADVITDFTPGADELHLRQSLWGGGLTSSEVVRDLASVSGGAVVFDFGDGQTITLEGLTTTAGLADDLTLI